jgi:hypothetical protein
MSRLYAEGRWAELVAIARAGMLRTNWVLTASIIVVGFTAKPLLSVVGSDTPFVAPAVWWLLGLAFLFERIGAMHLQLYSVTNRIVWHFANGVSGLVMLCAIPLAYDAFGVEGLPIGILIAYGGFYVPYGLFQSYRTFHLEMIRMDMWASILPVLIVLLFLLDTMWYRFE